MKKILIVEDEPDEARSMQLILEENGFKSVIKSDVKSALNELKKDKFNLVLLDIILPLQLGNALLEKMKRDGISVPVVVVTAISSKLTDVEKDLRKINKEIGFIHKPFTEKTLLREIKKKLK